MTTTVADEFLVGFMGGDSSDGSATHTAAAGFTLLDQVTNGVAFWTGASAYRIVSATGSYQSQFTEVSAGLARVWIATFKVAPIAAAPRGHGRLLAGERQHLVAP